MLRLRMEQMALHNTQTYNQFVGELQKNAMDSIPYSCENNRWSFEFRYRFKALECHLE
jgi:hypothetical protein